MRLMPFIWSSLHWNLHFFLSSSEWIPTVIKTICIKRDAFKNVIKAQTFTSAVNDFECVTEASKPQHPFAPWIPGISPSRVPISSLPPTFHLHPSFSWFLSIPSSYSIPFPWFPNISSSNDSPASLPLTFPQYPSFPRSPSIFPFRASSISFSRDEYLNNYTWRCGWCWSVVSGRGTIGNTDSVCVCDWILIHRATDRVGWSSSTLLQLSTYGSYSKFIAAHTKFDSFRLFS